MRCFIGRFGVVSLAFLTGCAFQGNVSAPPAGQVPVAAYVVVQCDAPVPKELSEMVQDECLKQSLKDTASGMLANSRRFRAYP